MTEVQLVSSIESTEAKIAACMSDAGFQYTPIDVVTFRAAQAALKTAPGLNDAQFVEQYGFGISTLPPTKDFRVGEQNAAIYNALSPADKIAYDRTLLGDDKKATFLMTLEAEDFSTTGGCTKKAVEQVFTSDQLNGNYVNPIDALIEQDQRTKDARKKWTTCMHDAGYNYETQQDAEDDFTQRLDSIAHGADLSSLDGSARDSLTQLQGEERAVAKADMNCARQFLDDVLAQVESDITGRAPQ
jgi:truncated hemoglobin YjbI